MEHPLGAEDVDPIAVDDRAAARAVVVVVKVLVVGRVIKRPQFLAGFALEGGEAGAIADAVEEKSLPRLMDGMP
jgi:hypothetical protein